jgi:transketolase
MKNNLDTVSIEQRKTILKILERNGRGHIGSAFSILEITRVLYDSILEYDPTNPTWSKRDRFILSKGHGCLALYVQLAEKGFFSEEELWKVSEDGAMLGGHPEYGLTPGIEASTGSLGHGLSIGVGIALSAAIDKKKFHVFVLIGDGECNEGTIWEAALSASKHSLSNLTVILDCNKFQCFGPTEKITNLEPLGEKWQSFGFEVREIDGHDTTQIRETFETVPFSPKKPSLVICHTIKGSGISEMENNPSWHHKSKLTEEELKKLYNLLDVENA